MTSPKPHRRALLGAAVTVTAARMAAPRRPRRDGAAKPRRWSRWASVSKAGPIPAPSPSCRWRWRANRSRMAYMDFRRRRRAERSRDFPAAWQEFQFVLLGRTHRFFAPRRISRRSFPTRSASTNRPNRSAPTPSRRWPPILWRWPTRWARKNSPSLGIRPAACWRCASPRSRPTGSANCCWKTRSG